MPKRTDIKKIMVIGSGPIIIGQAAEFDYAGTQACLALKEEGYEVVLVNSNPATIMTDQEIADQVYIEPITLEFVSRILRKERPDALLPTLGGQTGLNMAMELAESGILDELGFVPNETAEGSDVIIINTCAIRQNAEEKVLGEIGNFKRLYRENKDLVIGVCGCMAQEEGLVETLLSSFIVWNTQYSRAS